MSGRWFANRGQVVQTVATSVSTCVALIALYFVLRSNNSLPKASVVLYISGSISLLLIGFVVGRRSALRSSSQGQPHSVQNVGSSDTVASRVPVESDPRIYVDVLDKRDGFAGTTSPATPFRYRNEGGSVAHNVQFQPIDSPLGQVTFKQVDSIAAQSTAEVKPEIEKHELFQKNNVATLLRNLWNSNGDLTERFVMPCTVTYEDYTGTRKFESAFDIVYLPPLDIMRERSLSRGNNWPADRVVLEIANRKFRRL
jgi:hypothetical protein